MLQSCSALTLRTYPFGEANKVAVFLSPELGQLRGVAYGAARSKSRFGSGLEPLSQVRLSYRRKENQELAVIENCEIIRPSPAYRLDWGQSLYFGYFAELLVEFSREQAPNERLFRLALAVIEASESVSIQLLARYFEYWLLRLEGVLPGLEQILPADVATRASAFLKLPPLQLEDEPLPEADLDCLERAAEKLIESQLEKPLKAKRMLRELL